MSFKQRAAYWLTLSIFTIGVTILVLLLLAAPYFPRLVQEGYPKMTWPAQGSFADIGEGGRRAHDISRAPAQLKFDEAGRREFEDKGGNALLIYQDGALRFEHYATGVTAETRFNSYSMVKSLVGALVLKAHSEALIADLSDPIGRYLPAIADADVGALPIRSLLRMHSGIIFEPKGAKAMFGGEHKNIERFRVNPFGPMARLHMTGMDRLIGELRVDRRAVGVFDYQNVNTAILGRLLAQVYQKPLQDILHEKIWRPAGAGKAHWRQYGAGKEATPYCCIYATTMDWLKIGVYLVHNGDLGSPFLPEPLWRRLMGLDLSRADIARGRYGLHVYHDVLDRDGEALQGPFTYFFGSGGQITYLMPDEDLVVVRFGEKIQLLHTTLYAAWRTLEP
jgi:CubicO group peptidase (beta-lactamase class C family)